jgi:mono/diheme cytochrome c family protein
MIASTKRGGVLLCALLLSSASLAVAQESQTQIKKVPIQRTSAASGAEMYAQYCAACHGPSGKGDGPAAPAFKTPPADLTTLAKRHGGKYPDDYVVTALQFGVQEAKAHGSKDMPVWGPLLGSISSEKGATTTEVKLRISNLTEYLKSLQSM